jgi:hypothetical protein
VQLRSDGSTTFHLLLLDLPERLAQQNHSVRTSDVAVPVAPGELEEVGRAFLVAARSRLERHERDEFDRRWRLLPRALGETPVEIKVAVDEGGNDADAA